MVLWAELRRQELREDYPLPASGAQLIQYPCHGASYQLWNLGTLSYYSAEGISSVYSGH